MAEKENNQENSADLVFGNIIQKEIDSNESHDRSIVVIGPRGLGKSTMIHRFLEREDTARPSIAMEYYYGRKAGKSLVKDVVHIWEVVFLHKEIILSALTGSFLSHSPHHLTIMVMLDLSKPEVLWHILEECFTSLSKAVQEYYKPDLIKELKDLKLKSLRESAKGNDMDLVAENMFPLRLCIIGARYDEFRDMEGVDKEFIGQILRAVSLVTGATLQYHSAKDLQLLRRTKELLGHYAFKGHRMKTSMIDYDKPLFVPAGSDSFSAINLKFLQDESKVTLNTIKKAYEMRFPQNWRKLEMTFEDSTNDPNFIEPIIDRLRHQREQEIDVSLRDMMEKPPTDIPIPEPF